MNEAGYCIVSSATADGYTYICVAMGSPMLDSEGYDIDYHGEMADSRELFRWALLNLEKKTVAAQGDLLGEVKLEYAYRKDTLQLVAGDNASALLPKAVNKSSVTIQCNVPESVQAPIKKGEQVGTATLSYADEVIATTGGLRICGAKPGDHHFYPGKVSFYSALVSHRHGGYSSAGRRLYYSDAALSEETETVEKGQTFSGYVSGIEREPRFLPSRKEVREEMRPFYKKRNSRKWLFRFFLWNVSALYGLETFLRIFQMTASGSPIPYANSSYPDIFNNSL